MPNRNPAGSLDLKPMLKNGIRTAPVLVAMIALFWASIALAATSETKAPPLAAPAAPAQQGECTLQGDLRWIDPTDGGALYVNFAREGQPSLGIKTPVGSMQLTTGTTVYGFCLDSTKDVIDDTYCFDVDTSDWRLSYLLTKYPPQPNNRLLQAAHQAAMWHYTNGINLKQDDPVQDGPPDADTVVRNEYNAILADIDSFGGNPPPIFNAGPLELTVSPSSKSATVGKGAQFTVHLAKGGTALAGYTVNVATSIGSVDASSRVTDGNGNAVFTVTSNQTGSGNVVASASVQLPAGQRFLSLANPDGEQPVGVPNSQTESPSGSASVTFTPRSSNNSSPQNVPEPMTIILFGTGLAALGAAVAKRKNKI
ncbi:MAG: Ig-like domain-containing protein [Anaerolineales bacterium]|nr:Ig-like domain-containing protein [Anaerolineales bacterium]